MPNRLTELDITEVSFVDSPADPNARIELFKRDESVDKADHAMHVTTKGQPSSSDVMEEGILGSKKSKKRKKEEKDDDIDLEKGSDSSYSPARTDTEDGNMPPADEMEFTPEQEEYVRSLEDKTMDAEELVKSLTEEIEVLKDDDTDDSGSDEILKSASPEVVELVKAAEARAANAEEIVKAERDTRLRRDAVEKAAEYDSIGVDKDELGSLLFTAGEVLDTETMEKLHDVLKMAKEAADVSALYEEIGKSGEGNFTDAEERLDVAAKEIQKNSTDLTYEQAYEKALDANPEAYNETIGR